MILVMFEEIRNTGIFFRQPHMQKMSKNKKNWKITIPMANFLHFRCEKLEGQNCTILQHGSTSKFTSEYSTNE